MRILALDASPPLLPVSYDDVVEVSVAVPVGARARWATWGSHEWGPLEGLAPGSYRVRVSAHGRDAGRDGEFEPGVVDDYVVELWPAPRAPDEIVRTGSADAAYWHHEVGGRR